jgi:uncharacterized protein YlxP (DUF503 family)
MFIGMARYELFIPASESLKDKRRVVKSISSIVRNKLNVSIAEVDHQELWQRTALGVSCVSESIGHCRKVMQEAEKLIAKTAIDGAEIVDRSIDVYSMEDL